MIIITTGLISSLTAFSRICVIWARVTFCGGGGLAETFNEAISFSSKAFASAFFCNCS